MFHSDPTQHPDSEALAAYLDGRDSSFQRARIVRHAAECSKCREVIAETSRFQEEKLMNRKTMFVIIAVMAAIAAVATVLAILYL